MNVNKKAFQCDSYRPPVDRLSFGPYFQQGECILLVGAVGGGGGEVHPSGPLHCGMDVGGNNWKIFTSLISLVFSFYRTRFRYSGWHDTNAIDTHENKNYQKLTYDGFFWPSRWNKKKRIAITFKNRSSGAVLVLLI